MAKTKTAKTPGKKSAKKTSLPKNAAEIFATGKIVESVGKSLLKSVEGFRPKPGSSAHAGSLTFGGEINVAEGAKASKSEVATIGVMDLLAEQFDRVCGGAVGEVQDAVIAAVKQLKSSRKSAKAVERHEEIKKTLAKLVESAAIDAGFVETKTIDAKAGAVRTDPGYTVTIGAGKKAFTITHERKASGAEKAA